MCCQCKTLIPLGKWAGGRRYCERCGRSKFVWLRFKYIRTVWEVEFLDAQTWLTVGRKRQFESADTIRELVGRTPTRPDLATRQAFEFALQQGEGQIKLELTAEQFWKLKR